MKAKYLFLPFVLAAFLSSSIPSGSHALEVGKEAPLLTLSSNSSSPRIDNADGKFLILNFWNPSDPASRIRNRQLSRLASSLPEENVKFVSICTGSDSTLNKEISDADGISPKALQLSASDIAADVFDDYQTKSGLRTFIIDGFGNLKAISPTESQIKDILS